MVTIEHCWSLSLSMMYAVLCYKLLCSAPGTLIEVGEEMIRFKPAGV